MNMSDEASDEDIEQFVSAVADQLAAGVPQSEVVDQLVESGWEEDEARQLVQDIGRKVTAAGSSGGGEGMGWLLWIGILVGVNVLSYLFDWPFWLY